MTPQQIYRKHGEMKLRNLEHDVLKALQFEGDCVIAVGGGGFLTTENQKVLKTLGTLICLHMSKKSLLQRWVDWPLICQSDADFDEYYDERIEMLTKLSCTWIDATRGDLINLVLGVSHGK